ncbi:MAG TPA: BTAD domain-containing putative transcriptional regulator [Jiangellaceae bacterium]
MRQPPPLQLTLFNNWQLLRDRQPIQIPSRSQRLVALLALRGRQNRAKVAGILWPDVSEPRAQASLRAALSALQRRVPSLVNKDNGDICLNGDISSDVVEFRRQADQILNGHIPEPLPVLDDPALTGGELLPGWYDDWVFVEQERIHQLRLHVLEALAQELADRGAHPHALQMALSAVEIDPLRESARRAVINVHLSQGNTADAVREYERFSSLLQNELGVTPTCQMTDLIEGATTPSNA